MPEKYVRSHHFLAGLQIVTDALVKRPQPGDPSYALYQEELMEVLKALEEKATLVYTKMNQIPGVRCNEVQGAMYAYPQIDIPEEAEEDAKVCCTLRGLIIISGVRCKRVLSLI